MGQANDKLVELGKIKQIVGDGPKLKNLVTALYRWDVAGITNVRATLDAHTGPIITDLVEFFTELEGMPAYKMNVAAAIHSSRELVKALQQGYTGSYLRHDATTYLLLRVEQEVFSATKVTTGLNAARQPLEAICKHVPANCRYKFFEFAEITDVTREEGNAFKAMLKYPALTFEIGEFHIRYPRLEKPYSESTIEQLELAFHEIERIPKQHPTLNRQQEEDKFVRHLNGNNGQDYDWEARKKARQVQTKIINILGLG